MEKYIRINKIDNVIVALEDINPGDCVLIDDKTIVAKDLIPAGHKMAVTSLSKGAKVIKYGQPIGAVKEDTAEGSHIHIHNLVTLLSESKEYSYEPLPLESKENSYGPMIGGLSSSISKKRDSFMGYERADGRVGVRNEIWIISTVGCVAKVAEKIASMANRHLHDGIDEVVALTHPYGCSQMGEDQENTRKVLANLIKHPNAGGVLVLGLGCENSNIEVLKPYLGDYDKERIRFLVAQECEDEILKGVDIVDELMMLASSDVRKPVSLSKLVVGLKCGGSDGFSGITANPCVGVFSDLLINNGGTTILTEVPEMFGAETLLMNRCENKEIFDKTVNLINDFKDYFTSHGQTVYENPSPGNKKGGISTLEDKSLGCTQKSGSTPVKGVLKYAEPVSHEGLNLLSAPGNDLVAATALAASGAQIVLFTTGRGTPFSCPVPTVKISSNSTLFEGKRNWIDFNAGEVVEGSNVETVGGKLFDFVMGVAEGKKVKSELAGFHDMAIFKQGVTL